MKIYRDRDGDLWSRGDREPGQGAFLAVAPEFRWQGPTSNMLGDVQSVHGPLQELGAEDFAKHAVGLRELLDYLTPREGPTCAGPSFDLWGNQEDFAADIADEASQ